MSAKPTPSTRSPSTRKERNLSSPKEEEDMTISKRDSEDRKNQSSIKKLRSQRRSLLSLSAENASKKDFCALEELDLSSSTRRRKPNNKNLRIIFLSI